NFQSAADLISEYQPSVFNEMREKEDFIDRCETVLSDYVVKIDRRRLTNDNKMVVLEILNSVGDFERIGDYCMNMAYVASRNDETGLKFSVFGSRELQLITEATQYTLKTVIKAFAEDNGRDASRVEPLADVIDHMKEIIKAHHVERLQDGTCTVEGGVALLDLINGFERIASHASNIALHIVKRTTGDKSFDDMHGHIFDPATEEYKALQNYYDTKYIVPLVQMEKMETEKPGVPEKTEETLEKPDETAAERIPEPEHTSETPVEGTAVPENTPGTYSGTDAEKDTAAENPGDTANVPEEPDVKPEEEAQQIEEVPAGTAEEDAGARGEQENADIPDGKRDKKAKKKKIKIKDKVKEKDKKKKHKGK
ncbi:MAG: hypothetical protein IJ873_09310, partial [Lachnospiraceae bacterium]|nr:hypothetical protein [Lachnospiraceae bacterium]